MTLTTTSPDSKSSRSLMVRKQLPGLMKIAVDRRIAALQLAEESLDTDAKAFQSSKRESGALSPDIFSSAPQRKTANNFSHLLLAHRQGNQGSSNESLNPGRFTSTLSKSSSQLSHISKSEDAFPNAKRRPLFDYSEGRPQIILNPPTPYSSNPSLPRTPTPMECRRGTQPVGTNFPNSIPPNFLQQNLSFGSTESTDSNESFCTQVPMPYYMPQEQNFNGHYTGNNSGYIQHGTQARSTGSNGSHLNPTSSPYIPQGNTPILPAAGTLGQGWGAPYAGGQTGQVGLAMSYQQRQNTSGMQMQYQNRNQYQQPQMGGPVGIMNPQVQSQFGNIDPYGHFGAAIPPQDNFNQYNNANGQMPQMPYATPDIPYGNTAAPTQTSNMQCEPGPIVAPVIGQTFSYSNGNGANSSFQSQYNNRMPGSSSFDSASTMYTNPTSDMSFKPGTKQQQSRPGSVQSPTSGMHDQKKLFNPNGKDRNNSHRGIQCASRSSTPAAGGPVNPPKGVRDVSPEKIVPQSHNPESFRNHRKSKSVAVIEDTGAVPTPVSKPHPSDANFTSEERGTPHLRSRRGQTITSATDTIRKSVSTWAAGIPVAADPGVNLEDMKRRGSPVPVMSNALSMVALQQPDPFVSTTGSSNPFGCMTDGPFVGNFPLHGPFSNELMRLTNGCRNNPSVVDALAAHNVPLVEYCRLAKIDNWGVIKIKNIPYGVNRAEVLAFLGRNARIINESEAEPIHIVMERVTSKTLDCFVEFVNLGEAVAAVNRFETNRMGGRGGRLGQRHVEVELSTQGALMKELFPKAKNVRWDTGKPLVIERDPNDPYNSGFQGFVTKEELIMMRKHVETPQRSPFSKDCPQRPFECLISTLVKYPWYMVEYITIEDRNMLHGTTIALLELLVDRVNNNEDQNVNMSKMLLKRVWRAALQCQGFTPSMKDDIVFIASLSPQLAIEHGLAPHASYWNKLWCIGPKPGAPVDVVLWYIGKIRQACVPTVQLSLAEQAEKGVEPQEVKLFGDLDKYINYGPNLAQMSLAAVAKIEWAAIENALRRGFTQALPPSH